MLDLQIRVHNEPKAGPTHPVTELDIFENRQKVFCKSTKLSESFSVNSQSMRGEVIGIAAVFRLKVIDKSGLKLTEEDRVVWHGRVCAADHHIWRIRGKIPPNDGKGVLLQEAVCIHEKQNIAFAVECPCIPRS